jgi:hypothetical protein
MRRCELTQVRLYTRPGCHLCDEARDLIRRMRGELREFDLDEIDIDSDDELLSAYLERIPVLAVDGRIVSELELDGESLRANLGRLGAR